MWSGLTTHRRPHSASYPAAVWGPAGKPWLGPRHFRHSNGPPMAGSDGGNRLGPASAGATGKAAPCQAPAHLQPSARMAPPTSTHARTHAQSCAIGHYSSQLLGSCPTCSVVFCCWQSILGWVQNLKKDVWNLDQEVQFTYYTLTPRQLRLPFIYTSIFSHSFFSSAD